MGTNSCSPSSVSLSMNYFGLSWFWFWIISYPPEKQTWNLFNIFYKPTTDIDFKRWSMSHSPNVLPTKSLQKKNKCLVLHTPAAKKLKCSDNEQSLKDNPNLINSSSETPPSPLMSRASKSSLARSRGSNLVQSRSGSRTFSIYHYFPDYCNRNILYVIFQ